MFAHSASLHILTLVTGALLLQTVSAASPCPDITSYTLVYNPADPTGCLCMNNANNNEPAVVRIIIYSLPLELLRLFDRKVPTPLARTLFPIVLFVQFLSDVEYH
jgi:hypothetical protein